MHLATYTFACVCEHINPLFSYIRTFDSDIESDIKLQNPWRLSNIDSAR